MGKLLSLKLFLRTVLVKEGFSMSKVMLKSKEKNRYTLHMTNQQLVRVRLLIREEAENYKKH
jgi:hypothetical protein